MKHVISPGDKYGRLTVIREVRKAAPDGKRYRAALCQCDCGKEVTPLITSLRSGDARGRADARAGNPKYEQRRCPVCGTLALIRRDHKSCSRACGYELARRLRQALNPSYDVWHHRVKKARGSASGYACVDCGQPAQEWSTVNPASKDVRNYDSQPRCRKCHRSYDGGTAAKGHPRAKLTSRESKAVCGARRADGLTYQQLADEFGISDRVGLRGRQPQNLGARELILRRNGAAVAARRG